MTIHETVETMTRLDEYRAYIADDDARRALDAFIEGARRDGEHEFHPRAQGALIRTVQYLRATDDHSQRWPYGFIVNQRDLLFYFRRPSGRANEQAMKELQGLGLDAVFNNSGEIKIRVRNAKESNAVIQYCFGLSVSADVNVYPDEVPSDGTFNEGTVAHALVNRFERSAEARARCLAHFGPVCKVCNFDFERTFGSLGRGFMHVHHVVDLASIRANYVVNPLTDLVPVCPNCHAMLHQVRPAMSIDVLRELLIQGNTR